MMRLAACVLILGANLLQAQTTWQGLMFGATREQVRDALSPRGFSLHDVDGTKATAQPDFEIKTSSPTLAANLKPSVSTAPMFFTPELSFDAHGKLQAIKLNLDQARVLAATPAIQPLALLPYIAGTSAYEQLIRKYGPPSTQRGPCGDVSLASLVGSVQECSAKWNGAGQVIELFWSWSGLMNRPPRLLFFVLYTTADSSGL